MFASSSDSSSTQTSTISFRLKSSATTNLTVEFLGRDIRVADLKDKIAERLLSYAGGANLQLYETSGRLLSDANEKVPAFSEILVVRTNEAQAGSNFGGGAGGAGAAAKEKTAGALGTINAAKKMAQEVSNMSRRSELDFGADHAQQTHQQKLMQASSLSSTGRNAYNNNNSGANNNNNNNSEKSEEEKLQELQDIVARDMGVGSSTYGGRGVGGNYGRGGFQQHNAGGSSFQPQGQGGGGGGFAAGKSVTAGGQAMAAAPSANYVCHLCGEYGHFISHCPKANNRGGGGVPGGQQGGRGGGGPPGQNNNQHHQRRFAQPTGIPESELERCSPEEAMFITRDGQYVRRRMVGLGASVLGTSTTSTLSLQDDSLPPLKCMHCSKIYPDIKSLQKLPCNCASGKIACSKCVDDGKCLEMSDDGPVCAKCGKEIDADEIVSAKLDDLRQTGGQRRDRQ